MNSEVGTGSANFTYIYKNEVPFEVGIRSADFKCKWESAQGMPTSKQWKSASAVLTSIFLYDFVLEVGKWNANFRTVEVGNLDADFISVVHSILEGFYN